MREKVEEEGLEKRRCGGMLGTMSKPLTGYKVGFVGLGNMGWANVRHLQAAGADVVVWTRSGRHLNEAAALGMEIGQGASDVARRVGGGIVCVNVSDTAAVESVVFGPGGLFEGFSESGLVIDFGTTGVGATRRFAERMAWVDAPVSGGQVGAEARTLTVMAGGSEENFRRAEPVLRAVGSRVTHMGPVGSGQVTKLANQLIVAQTIDAVAQALRMAELAGVEPARVREALIGGFAASRVLELHGDRMIRRDFAPGGRAALQLKDVRLIADLAREVGLESPTLANSLEQWVRFVEERGWGDLDHSGLFKLYEK
jgi:3-hydroxyisobutyrate dehydrogenase-like beta-hydroxyacid dehydrogenase